MAQIDTTNTFIDGDTVNAAAINNIIDQAFAEAAIITGQTSLSGSIAPASDMVLVYDASVTGLRKALVSALQAAGLTDVLAQSDNAFFNLVASTPGVGERKITASFDNVGQNKVLAAPANGDVGAPTFRALTLDDLPSAVGTISIAANTIDCTAGYVFTKTLPSGTSFNLTISALADGQTIRVGIINNAAGNNHVSWALSSGTLVWRGGTTPVVTQSAGARDIFTFTRIASLTYGYADQGFTT